LVTGLLLRQQADRNDIVKYGFVMKEDYLYCPDKIKS